MKNIIEATRTYRRFDSKHKLSEETLMSLVDLGRLGGSARNCQPWQYMIITSDDMCKSIFPFLGWAGYLTDWKGPETDERPNAYILCYLNKNWLIGSEKEAHFDLGISSQNMLLGASELGLGGCRIGSFSPKLADKFPQPEHLELQLVIALGRPVEKVVIDECEGDSIKYWRDADAVHHVPKRSLADILLQPPADE